MTTAPPIAEDLYTISAGGFSATADAYARDPDSGALWFVSMVGPQTSLKAIWGSLLKQPPADAHIIQGVEGMTLSGNFHRCHVPQETIGTWTTKLGRLPATRGYHALVYTRLAEYNFDRDNFLLLIKDMDRAPALFHRFLDKRSPLPLHHSWKNWLWRRGLSTGEITPLDGIGLSAFTCNPNAEELKEDLSAAILAGTLTVQEDTDGPHT